MTVATKPPKVWLTDLRPALEPSIPPDIPPAAWTTPPKKFFPHVFITALYRSGCPPMSGELASPGPYGTLCSKSMYDMRTLRVQVVQRVVEFAWGCRKKKRRLVERNVVVFGMTAGVWVVARLVLETVLQSHCLAFDIVLTVTSTLAFETVDEEGVLISVTQYLLLSSFVHTACLSGIKA